MDDMNNAPENSFFRWIRGLGIQRSENRWVGGVAAGIGHKLGIDPILARGLVVVITLFTGVGLLLYGLAWALLPERDGRIHAQEAGRGRWTAGMTGAVVFTVLGLLDRPGPFGGWYGAGGRNWWGELVWTAVIVGAIIWFFTSRRNAKAARRPMAYDAASSPAAGGPSAGPLPGDGAQEPRRPAGATAYAGTDAGHAEADTGSGAGGAADAAATQRLDTRAPHPTQHYPAQPTRHHTTTPADAAADTPEDHGMDTTQNQAYADPYPGGPYGPAPAAVVPAARQRTLPGHTVAIVLGIAVLAAGVVLLASMLQLLDLGGKDAAVALAVAVTVMGAGLVGAALRRHRGGALTGFTIALLVPTILISGASTQRFENLPWAGPIIEDSGHEFTYVFQSGTLDLTHFGRDMAGDTTVRVNNVFSDLDLVVPENIPVQITGDGAFYSMTVDSADASQRYSGVAKRGSLQVNPSATGPTLTVVLDGAFNNVTVTTQEVTP